MTAIAAFNWPFYLAAAVVCAVALSGMLLSKELSVRVVCALALAGASYFLIVSLGVSHLVYDRSDLYRWNWLQRALAGGKADDVIVCHCGFDEVSRAIDRQLPGASLRVLDHFDEKLMTEASVRRARRRFPPEPGTADSPYSEWPIAAGTTEVVFGILAIHELRKEQERADWFREAARCLRLGGRVVLVEHVRDLANFVAFGPGFLHFHSPENWRRCWERAGLRLHDEFRVTAWVRVFILTRRHD
jgi:hypothetical protein